MKLKDKIKIRRFNKFWEKQGRKDMFTWAHRYLRLHSDLLEDNVYQIIYDFVRNELTNYLKNDIDLKNVDDLKLNEIIDALADAFNEKEYESVNKYKPLVDELYNHYKEEQKFDGI